VSLLLAHHRRTLAYDDWANAATLASIVDWHAATDKPRSGGRKPSRSARSRAPERARLLFAHIVAAESLWIARIRGERPAIAVWPDLALDDCEEQHAAVVQAWHGLFASFRSQHLERSVTYVNSKGERWVSTIGDIVTHVVLHSAYHRGQVAALARSDAAEPAYTDFIHCVRNACIEPLGAVTAPPRATRRGSRAAPSARATARRDRSKRTTPSHRS